jgi:hypothetical protein
LWSAPFHFSHDRFVVSNHHLPERVKVFWAHSGNELGKGGVQCWYKVKETDLPPEEAGY